MTALCVACRFVIINIETTLKKKGIVVLLGSPRTLISTFGLVIEIHRTFGLVIEIHRTFGLVIENHSTFGLVTKKVSYF